MVKLHTLHFRWENRDTFKATGKWGSVRKNQGLPELRYKLIHYFGTQWDGFLLRVTHKREPIMDASALENMQALKKFSWEMGDILMSWHFILLNTLWEKPRGMRVFCYHGNLERPGLADDTKQLTMLGTLILDKKNGAVEASDWVRMNTLLFLRSSATLSDFKKIIH